MQRATFVALTHIRTETFRPEIISETASVDLSGNEITVNNHSTGIVLFNITKTNVC